MPASGTQFKNRLMPVNPIYNNGIMSLGESGAQGFGAGNFTLRESCGFQVSTGTTLSPDVTPGQSSNVTLIPDGVVPYGTRCYLTAVTIDVQGAVNWGVTSPTAGAVPYLSLQDSLGVPAIVAPFMALKGLSDYAFPSADVSVPLLLGPGTVNGPVGTPVTTFTYVQATGVITPGAGIIFAGIGVGSPCRVVDGTGKGQAAIVTALTGTPSVTVYPPFTGLDATSVIGIDWQPTGGGNGTTTVNLSNVTATYTANALDNGYGLVCVGGTGVGTFRPVQSNTTAGVCTMAYAFNTALVSGNSLVQVTNENNLNGIVDTCVGDKWATLSLNKGLQIAVNLQSGTSPVGSNVRVYCEGFFAA